METLLHVVYHQVVEEEAVLHLAKVVEAHHLEAEAAVERRLVEEEVVAELGRHLEVEGEEEVEERRLEVEVVGAEQGYLMVALVMGEGVVQAEGMLQKMPMEGCYNLKLTLARVEFHCRWIIV